jgi:hypothetical protein
MDRVHAAFVPQVGVVLRCFISLLIVALLSPPKLEAQVIAAGKTFQVKLKDKVTTKSAHPGDVVTAHVADALKDNDGIVVPAGSTLHGRVDFVQRKSVTEDGSLRLIFSRFELPDGRAIETLATASFRIEPPKGKRDHIIAMGTLSAIGGAVGGRKRLSAALGGAIVGLILVENKHRFGRDITLRAGRTIELRLSDDLTATGR